MTKDQDKMFNECIRVCDDLDKRVTLRKIELQNKEAKLSILHLVGSENNPTPDQLRGIGILLGATEIPAQDVLNIRSSNHDV